MKTENSSGSSASSSARHSNQLGVALGLLGLVACMIFVCPFLLQLAGGIVLGILMSGSESVRHSVPSPDRHITALVIADDCGATCGCKIRVDLKTETKYIEEIWRGWDICDATVTWLNATELLIVDDERHQIQIDTSSLGLSP